MVVQDKNGDVHLFAHLESAGVKVGSTVKRGSYLGKTGSTGNSSGAHLHYEVRKGGKLHDTIDPHHFL